MATNPRPYRVSVLGSNRPRTFGSTKTAIAFARSQAQQSLNDDTWTVWDNRTNDLVCRVSRSGDVTWAESRQPRVAPVVTGRASFRSPAKAFDAQGQHTGPGEWLTVIRTANGIAQDEGQALLFESPDSTGDWWAGGYVEEYPEARVLHRTDNSVSVISKTPRAADLIRRAAEKHGWVA